jgi:hypothetical protein
MDLNIRHTLDKRRIKKPVGFLGPDGRWFLIDASENGLAHIELAEHVYDEYADYIQQNRIYVSNYDVDLEHAGIIKVHGWMVRYFTNSPFYGYYDQSDCKTPEVTDVQMEQLYEYAKKFGDSGKLSFNYNYPQFSFAELRQMDRIQINRLFTRDRNQISN